MIDKANNILVDYEGLCEEIKLITEHGNLANKYRQELSHERT